MLKVLGFKQKKVLIMLITKPKIRHIMNSFSFSFNFNWCVINKSLNFSKPV